MTMTPCHTHGIEWSRRHTTGCPICQIERRLRAAERERERQQREIQGLRERISEVEDRLGEPPAEVVVAVEPPVAADGSGGGSDG